MADKASSTLLENSTDVALTLHTSNVSATICTGQYLAENSVWSAIATILFTCTITNAVDNKGKDIIPEVSMSYGFASHPDNFQCLVKPRTSQAETLASDTELKDH
ncbi:hypothetical protein DFH06DRAFT_1327469 [Mycena polygramma]|nr:hypothetical protein DFH06DRAFT_1327469 [Mycena polygramma]